MARTGRVAGRGRTSRRKLPKAGLAPPHSGHATMPTIRPAPVQRQRARPAAGPAPAHVAHRAQHWQRAGHGCRAAARHRGAFQSRSRRRCCACGARPWRRQTRRPHRPHITRPARRDRPSRCQQCRRQHPIAQPQAARWTGTSTVPADQRWIEAARKAEADKPGDAAAQLRRCRTPLRRPRPGRRPPRPGRRGAGRSAPPPPAR